jgi:hypothetical protein
LTRLSPWKCDLCEGKFLTEKRQDELPSFTLSMPRSRTVVEDSPRAILTTLVPHRYDLCPSCAELVKSILLQRETFLDFVKAWREAGHGLGGTSRYLKKEPVRSIALTEPWTKEGEKS